jgi:hypothetical protein
MLVGGSVYGALLTAAGLGIAYLVLATPLTEAVSAHRLVGAGRVPIGPGIAAISMIAGMALLLAGTNQLAVTLARLKRGDPGRGPGLRALAKLADEVVVVADVVPIDGRSVPEIAIGPFGAAVIHALPASPETRPVGTGWEMRTRAGWAPMENPLDLAVRDAERVRRWLAMADLDFVVRVYAAVVVANQAVPRSTTCAVLSADQLPAWISALPPQRTLTATRRIRLQALATTSRGVRAAGGW